MKLIHRYFIKVLLCVSTELPVRVEPPNNIPLNMSQGPQLHPLHESHLRPLDNSLLVLPPRSYDPFTNYGSPARHPTEVWPGGLDYIESTPSFLENPSAAAAAATGTQQPRTVPPNRHCSESYPRNTEGNDFTNNDSNSGRQSHRHRRHGNPQHTPVHQAQQPQAMEQWMHKTDAHMEGLERLMRRLLCLMEAVEARHMGLN